MSKTAFNIASEIKNPGKLTERSVYIELPDISMYGRTLVTKTPVKLEISYCYDGEGGVNADGRISAVFSESCARCGKEFDMPFECEFSERFVRLGKDDRSDPNADSYTFMGEVLELSDFVRDTLLLHMPIASICKETCKGLCVVCGCDLNVEKCGCRDAAEINSSTDNDDDLAGKLKALQEKFQDGRK